MKVHIILLVFGCGCLLSVVESQCDLKGRKTDRDFPDITKSVADSYVMGVEYTVPGGTAAQTDYYTEYYEVLFKRGRVESHISGQNQVYIYRSETMEAWTLENTTCTLQNITGIPKFFKDAQTDWLHYATGSEVPTTVGPSAMFKTAFDVWNNTKDKTNKMAYMGEAKGLIRGEKAVFWRRCFGSAYVDYFFAVSSEENAFDSDSLKKFDPLRVVFNGVSQDPGLSTQVYDIMSFQNFIPAGVEPFQLPRGKNCNRGLLVDSPKLPDFSSSSLLLSAEVVYKKLDKDKEIVSSYYSTLMFALDRESNHLAYYYSAWNTTKPDPETKEPFVDAPEYVIYDITHMYAYKINYESGQCITSRSKSFIPQYKLPEDGGYLALTDPYVLFPNSELKFLTEGKDRGLDVNIFETSIEDYLLDNKTVIPRAIVSHAYLKPNEELENSVAVRNAPTSMELHFFRKPDVEEVLTLNIFRFTTRIPQRRYIFDVKRCFKNDDDYLFMTIGFEIENQYLDQIEKALPTIEQNVFQRVTSYSELNPVRIPSILTDFKDNYVYVSLVILGKPTLELDFPIEDRQSDMSIKAASDDDLQGVSDFDTCANNCVEERSDCWGFSLCGGKCTYGSSKSVIVQTEKNCILYRRFSNKTYMLSKESQANNILSQVQSGEFNIMAILGDGKRVTLTATVADITDPAEDDSMFQKMGNLLNPRMRVVKAGKKLKIGTTVQHMGKLRYDECQSLCLDFKACETLSYCMKKSSCMFSNTYETDLKPENTEDDNLCILLSRKYSDHFDRTPGVFMESEKGTKKNFEKVEDCARACLKEENSKCLSFDHCSRGDNKGCSLYTVHYLKPSERKAAVKGKDPTCGHYTRKYSTEFKRKDNSRILGSKVPPITNLTLEECAKTCVEYGEGTCFAYDFCQGSTLYATSCTIIDSDPSRLTTSYSPVCTNYARTEKAYAPHPYTSSYAGGVGFACFFVGAVIGAVIVFIIAYIRSNRG